MDAETQRRIAHNESRFRTYNERIRDAVDSFRHERVDEETVGFLCECAISECTLTVELTEEQYLEVRSDPAWFVVAPDHVIAGVERVEHDRGSYWIIAKEGAGREVAEAEAPN